MNQILTQRDLEDLFAGKKQKVKSKKKFISAVLWFSSLIVLFLALFLIVNFESLKNNIFYKYSNDYAYNNDNSNTAQIVISNNKNWPLERIDNDSILIKSIEVTAPISWDVKNEPDLVAKNLENGIIHIQGTAHPGEVGNVFITGHSSNYAWAPGKYKSVFSLLNQLVVGDLVQLKYKNVDYLYRVSQSRVVKPTDLSVMNDSDDSILTLMTCTPVGTSLNRLIVTANQVHPEKSSNVKIDVNVNQNHLPNIR